MPSNFKIDGINSLEFNVTIISYIFRDQFEFNIIGNGNKSRTMSFIEIPTCPQFLRFNRIGLFYTNASQSIEEKCMRPQNYLQPLKPALNDVNMIVLNGCINQNVFSEFHDATKFLEHVHNELLPCFYSFRGFKLDFPFFSEWDAIPAVIESILLGISIKGCTNVEFSIFGHCRTIKLPFSAISRWLNGRCDDRHEHFFQFEAFCIDDYGIWDRFKKVLFVDVDLIILALICRAVTLKFAPERFLCSAPRYPYKFRSSPCSGAFFLCPPTEFFLIFLRSRFSCHYSVPRGVDPIPFPCYA